MFYVVQVPGSATNGSVDEQQAFVVGRKSRSRRSQKARGGEVAGAQVKRTVASVLWAGIGMGVPALRSMGQVAAAKGVRQILCRL